MLLEPQQEFLFQLLEDVQILQEFTGSHVMPPYRARSIAVPILRRWIRDRTFYRLQKILRPLTMSFEIPVEDDAIGMCEGGVFELWMVPLVLGSIGIASSHVAESHHNRDPSSRKTTHSKMFVTAKQFFEQKILFSAGSFYTREDIIVSHANTYGGVHLDWNDAAQGAENDPIKNYLGIEITNNNYQMLVGAQVADARRNPTRRNHTYDLLELAAVDTARIFSAGVLSAGPQLQKFIGAR
jgi:hypothetical protein